MKIRVNEIMTTHTQDYEVIPSLLKQKLEKYTVLVLRDNDEKRYTASLCDIKTLERFMAAKRYEIITALRPKEFLAKLDARASNIKNGHLNPDYSTADTLDAAWLVGYELLRLKILRLAGERA